MTKVQQDILMKLIEKYADLKVLKNDSCNPYEYTAEWRYAAMQEAERELPIVKGKIEKILKGLL